MILLLGATGYMGRAFAAELRRRCHAFIPLTRMAIDYTRFDLLFDYLRRMRPEFIINAAGFRGRPSVDTCETVREETLNANTLLPQTIARAAAMTNTIWGHISSGNIFQGAKVVERGAVRIERNLNQPHLRRLFDKHPEAFCGFTESDEPNFTFRTPPCNFYSGTKALAEEAIQGIGRCYLWRPGLLFSEHAEPGNLLWKIQNVPKVHDSISSVSHLGDFVRACLDLWEWQAPSGTYNVINPGAVTTPQIVERMQCILKPQRKFQFWPDDDEFYRCWAKAPRSNCILDHSKLLAAGIKLRSAAEALESALQHWCVKPAADSIGSTARNSVKSLDY